MEEKALRFNSGKPKWSLVHYKSIVPMIRVLEYGAHKYSTFISQDGSKTVTGAEITQEEAKDWILLTSGRNNWKKPMDLKEILESMQRHIAQLMDGEDCDLESGINHMGHIMCNAMFYNYHKDNELLT